MHQLPPRLETGLQHYLITDPDFLTHDPMVFETRLRGQIERHRPDLLLYRDKHFSDYARMAKVFLDICASYELKAMLHGDVRSADELRAYGLHLTSQQFDEITKAKALGLYVIVSTHSADEIEDVISLGADAVTYSPIFTTPGKGAPKGLEDLKEIVGRIPSNIFALGGITTPEQVNQVEATGTYGFASIRYFIEN